MLQEKNLVASLSGKLVTYGTETDQCPVNIYVLYMITFIYNLDTHTSDGSWGPWRIGQCSVTCGFGYLVRTRECNNPPPATRGKDCVGPSSEVQPCNEGHCLGIELHTCSYI